MVNNEIEIGPICSSLCDIARMATFFVEQTQGKALVHTDVFDAQLLGAFPERVGNFFVIKAPVLLAQLRTRIHFPSINLEVFHLPFHFIEFFQAKVGPDQTMRKSPQRARKLVDKIPRRNHLVWGKWILIPFSCGNSADDCHHRVAVCVQFFYIMGSVE